MKRLILAFAAALAFAGAASSQPQQPTIKPGQTFPIYFDHDGADASFRLWCGPDATQLAIVKNYQAAEVTKDPAPIAGGLFTHTITAPALPFGRHTCMVSAYNALGESKGAPIVVLVGTIPTAPQAARLVR